MTMASTTLKDFIGNWQLFLVGLLLSVSPVLGAATTSPSATINVSSVTSSGAGNPTSPSPPTVATTAAQTIATTTQAQSSSQGPTSTAALTTATTAPMTSMGPNTTAATSAPTTATTAPMTSMGPNTTAGTSATQPMSTSTGVSSSVTSSSGMNSSMTTSMGNTTGGLSNGTTAGSNSSMSTISCRSFMCNYSDCYSMYTSQNASMCPYGYSYCELTRETDICYTVNCSASCSMSCGNTSQSNCSVDCCNSTNCLNDTFASMMMTASTPMMTTSSTTTTTPSPTTTTLAPTTQAGKKCHTGQCNGATCYTNFNTHQVCSSSQPHCHLKKETVESSIQWTAGCTTNCSEETTCQTDSTPPPCYLECCNATLTSSCLFLNGTLNVPSFATRGPQRHFELVTSALVVFVISLML